MTATTTAIHPRAGKPSGFHAQCGEEAERLRRRERQESVRQLVGGDVLSTRDLGVDAAEDRERRERSDDRRDPRDRDEQAVDEAEADADGDRYQRDDLDRKARMVRKRRGDEVAA